MTRFVSKLIILATLFLAIVISMIKDQPSDAFVSRSILLSVFVPGFDQNLNEFDKSKWGMFDMFL
jgi:hypothetical protein